MTRLSGIWFAAAVTLAVLPHFSGWLVSYGFPSDLLGLISLVSLGLAALSGLIWLKVTRRMAMPWLEQARLAVVGVLCLIGAQFIGAWVYLGLWNPDQSPPFMTEEYAAQQAAIGAAVWGAALVLFAFNPNRRGRANG